MNMKLFKSAVNTKRTPVLFLNGAYCNSKIWEENYLDYYLENGFNCYTLDYENHSKATIDDYVQQVLACIEQIGEVPVIVAHSMGAGVIQKLYAEHKVEFPAWVLMAPIPPRGYRNTVNAIGATSLSLSVGLCKMQTFGKKYASEETLKYVLFSSKYDDRSVKPYVDMICDMPASVAKSANNLHIENEDLQVGFPVFLQAAKRDVLVSETCMNTCRATYKVPVTQYNCGHAIMLDHQWERAAKDSVKFINQHVELKISDVA